LHKKVLGLVTAVVATITIAACSEQLEGGAACPLLCPQQAVTLLDTTIDAVVIDTTVLGLPPIGSETFMMLASHGDTLDARAIVRYDTLPATYSKSGIDSAIVNIDTAMLVAPIVKPDSLHRPKAPITIEAYNVDTTDVDTVAAVLAPLFRPNRLIGSKTFAPESLTDTLRIPISTDTVLDRVRTGKRLRVGLRLVSSVGYNIQMGTGQALAPVQLRIKASLDTAATPVLVTPFSTTPTDATFLQGPLADYTIVVRGALGTPAGLLGVGGVPSRRVYFKFTIPSRIVDSTSIVRASLLLTQTPNRRLNAKDSVFIFPVPIVAAPLVSDIKTALQFLGGRGQLGLDSLKLAPGDSGVRSFEIVGLVRSWRLTDSTVSPRTLALASGSEGSVPQEINFFSSRAGNSLRPRLRLTYAPQTSTGLP
jgi:hypothetical protein